MASSAQVYANLGKTPPPGESQDERNPKLPAGPKDNPYKFLLEITHCTLTESEDAGVTQVIEHRVLESSTPLAPVGHVFATTITHLTGPDSKLKQGKVRNFLGAAFEADETDDSQPWLEMAMYANEKDACVGRRVRATTEARHAKKSGRPYVQVTFSKP